MSAVVGPLGKMKDMSVTTVWAQGRATAAPSNAAQQLRAHRGLRNVRQGEFRGVPALAVDGGLLRGEELQVVFGIRERLWNVGAVGTASLDEAVVERLKTRLLDGGHASVSEISCCMLTGAVAGRRRNQTARSARTVATTPRAAPLPLLPCSPFAHTQ